MESRSDFEPYVIVEAAPVGAGPVRRSLPEGRRPEVLLVDPGERPEEDAGPALFEVGFDVFRTADPSSARDLVDGRSSILMALVRLGPKSADAIRDLRSARPGLWIGMLGEGGAEAREGYREGADDLLPPDPGDAALRLADRVPLALRKRDRSGRHRRHRAWASPRAAAVATAAVALAFGVLAAVLADAWIKTAERWDLRLARFEQLLESSAARDNAASRAPERWLRSEALDLDRRRLEEEVLFHREQMREAKLGDVFRAAAPPAGRP
jgi:hypothetical protein